MSSYVVDSSCWVEILTSGRKASLCEQAIKKANKIYVPTLVLFEVYRKIAVTISEAQSLSAIGYLSQNHVLDLDRSTTLHAADLSIQLGLPMADSIVLAHAQVQGAELLTMDNDFSGIAGVRVIR